MFRERKLNRKAEALVGVVAYEIILIKKKRLPQPKTHAGWPGKLENKRLFLV